MKNFSVTVAISALDEAQNITAFLQSVLAQKEGGFVLEKILVISDGSTDQTAELAKTLNSGKIEVREYDERVGKSSRLNEIYKDLQGDILVQSDADVVLEHSLVIRDIILPIILDQKIGMCGGHPRPVSASTFTEMAVNCTFETYALFRKIIRGGNNIFSADGRLLAFRREFIQQVSVPEDMIANDAFTYFSCLDKGFAYRYVDTAIVLFRSPQTFREQVKQNTRFEAAPARMSKYFSVKLVNQEYAIPFNIFLKSVLRQAVRHPILCGYIFLVNAYCRFRAFFVEKHLTAKWQMAHTTKRLNQSI
jgi:poly-beta-1,6-N-acetyl-D-glucosamine synthase